LAILEINSYVGRFFASLLPVSPGVNAVAALDYAYEVVQAPIGILAISVATVLFPGMSERAAAGDRIALRQTVSVGVRSVLFLMVPISAVLVVFAEPVIRLVFERGEFGPAATSTVAACLAAYALGLVPMATYYVVTRTFYALHNMRTPVIIGGVMVVLNALLAYTLMRALGVPGIALASAVVASVNVALLLAILHRTLGPIDGARLAGSALRTGVATAFAVSVVWWVLRLGVGGLGQGSLQEAARLGAGLAIAAVLYMGACLVLRVDEVRLLRDIVRRAPVGGPQEVP
ncbi:MAG TPA: lipid II flippase MurJ, partial [bacterium]|nr:lipid II flippase MurJ [bacterium]